MLSCLPPAIPKPALLEETSWVEPVGPAAKAIATPGKGEEEDTIEDHDEVFKQLFLDVSLGFITL